MYSCVYCTCGYPVFTVGLPAPVASMVPPAAAAAAGLVGFAAGENNSRSS